ncbi:MAG: 16S rRNA (cytosine(967)-C(5))-methyltransferase RsmB [Nitrospiraceae bacterium]
MTPPPSPTRPTARGLALTVLNSIDRDACQLDEAIARALTGHQVDPRDRALLMELVHGVLRHRLALDWRLDHVADRPMAKLPALVAHILRLAAYQLIHLTKIPASAAVNEAVTLVRRRMREPHWAGFVNAVLRAMIRTAPPDLPDRAADPVAHLSIRYSCPPWLVTRWVERMGLTDAEALCAATCQPPPMTVRVNTMLQSRADVLAAWRAAGLSAVETVVSATGIQVVDGGHPSQWPGYCEGWFYVEDEAAHLIPTLLSPQRGERVLDACAAPGGKALHCVELMRGQGEVVTVDRSGPRLATLRDNIARLRATNVAVVAHDWRRVHDGAVLPEPLRRPFDRILLDAPCSALGILRRHPEGKWQKRADDLSAHRDAQREILRAVSRLLRPGGTIVYSTCSTEPEETIQIIDEFLASHREFVRESVADRLPTAALPWVTEQGDLCTAVSRDLSNARSGTDAVADKPLVDETTQTQIRPMDGFYAASLRRTHE